MKATGQEVYMGPRGGKYIIGATGYKRYNVVVTEETCDLIIN